MEGLCGPLMQGGVSFPSGIGRGASFHPETETEIGAIVIRQELACGITRHTGKPGGRQAGRRHGQALLCLPPLPGRHPQRQCCSIDGLPMPEAYSAGLLKKFDSGEADTAILDRAVLRVLTVKFRMGLLGHPFAMEGGELAELYSKTEADRAVTLRAARGSIVLLKKRSSAAEEGRQKNALIVPTR